MIRSILYFVVFIFFVILIGRLVIDWIQVFARDWRPRGVVLVIAEVIYSVTDPPLRALRPDTGPSVFLVEYAPGVDPDRAFLNLQRGFGRIVVRPSALQAGLMLAAVSFEHLPQRPRWAAGKVLDRVGSLIEVALPDRSPVRGKLAGSRLGHAG